MVDLGAADRAVLLHGDVRIVGEREQARGQRRMIDGGVAEVGQRESRRAGQRFRALAVRPNRKVL